MTATLITRTQPSASSRSGGLTRLFAFMTRSIVRLRAHAALSSLDDRMLRDIGLSRADVERLVERG